MSHIFGVRAGSGMDASHVSPQSVTAIITSGGMFCVGVLKHVQDVEVSMHHGCCCSVCSVRGGVCSSVVGVEAPWVWFGQALLPLSACPTPDEPMHCLRRYLEFHSMASQGCVPFTAVLVSDLG